MEEKYFKHYSQSLQRDMEYKIYGSSGRTLLAIPSQNGRFFDWEGFGMIEILRPWLDSGKIRLVTCDTIDGETWSDQQGDGYWRIRRHEAWFNYVVDELIPAVRLDDAPLMITGCSMGAFHAANFFFRRPDLFDVVIAMSGLYTADYGFPNYHDELTYANSPQAFIAGMPSDHPWIRMYNDRRIIICVGQGKWEDELLESTRQLDEIMRNKGINAWVDYWGTDVDHDWCWWRAQLPYFLGKVIG